MQDMKAAMKAHDAPRLSALRLLLAAIKQREVDDRVEATDELVGGVISKLIKQRRDSVKQYSDAGRTDLAQKEQFEIDVLSVYNKGLAGDKKCMEVIDAMVYQTAKSIGAMATVLDGKVDAVLLTGGIVHNDYIVDQLKKRVGFIAPVYVYPGEREMLSLGQQTYYALIGKEEVFEL